MGEIIATRSKSSRPYDNREVSQLSAIVHSTKGVELYSSDRLPVVQSFRGAWPVARNASAEDGQR
jgi:hypothetical protein